MAAERSLQAPSRLAQSCIWQCNFLGALEAVDIGKGYHFLGAANRLEKGDGTVNVAFGKASFCHWVAAIRVDN